MAISCVVVGAALEAIFMGAVNVGGAVTAEPVTATTLAVVFAVVMHMDQGGRIMRLHYEGILQERLDELGEMPLPPPGSNDAF